MPKCITEFSCICALVQQPTAEILLALPQTLRDRHVATWAEHKKEGIGKSYKVLKCSWSFASGFQYITNKYTHLVSTILVIKNPDCSGFA